MHYLRLKSADLPCVLVILGLWLGTGTELLGLDSRLADPEHPAHQYWDRPLEDAFTPLIPDLESGKIPLESRNEKAFVVSLLEALQIPVSSQLLVFSATSLQQPRISVRNPRALYFNENIYVGWVPGGQIEVVSIDPNLGAIFYIFDIPRQRRPLVIERSDRCMNCHARSLTGNIPGLTIKSVISGPNGGSLDAFRLETTGHSVPIEERFGGWHVTGVHGIKRHKGNLTGTFLAQASAKTPGFRRDDIDGLFIYDNKAGENYQRSKYPVETSDILAHLVFEHEIGFNNRAIEATYAARAFLYEDEGQLSKAHEAELETLANELVRYMLFAEETSFPEGGVEGDPDFIKEFRAQGEISARGLSLRDFDLKTRLFAHRCSYMVHSLAFTGLHPHIKKLVMERLKEALGPASPREFDYLPRAEKVAIGEMLGESGIRF